MNGLSATSYPRTDVTGLVLAGGRAQRMGGQDKGLVEVNGRPMVEYVLAVLRPQVSRIVINANRNQDRYAAYGCEVLADELSGFQGPLAGIATALASSTSTYLLIAPCDSPLLPVDLGPRLHQALVAQGADIAAAHDGARLQPVFSLLRSELLDSLRSFLAAGERKIDRWYACHVLAVADFADQPDAFLNINTPQERAALALRLAASA